MPATCTPTGPSASLTPAASRMLSKLQDGGVAFLTFSRKAHVSIRAAVELQNLGLVLMTGHHNGELKVALPVLTVDNHERASTVLCIDPPEWGTRRFDRDPSGRGHHSFGTGSNSALLFESDFGRWAVASWLPSAADKAAQRAVDEAWLDANRPGWRAHPPIEEDAGAAIRGYVRAVSGT